MNFILYLIIATISICILYITHKIIFRKEGHFKTMRFFLLIGIAVCLLLPFHGYKIASHSVNHTNVNDMIAALLAQTQEQNTALNANTDHQQSLGWLHVAFILYMAITMVFMIRILAKLIYLSVRFAGSQKEKKGKYIILQNPNITYSFSFFNFIFLQPNIKNQEDKNKILAHEITHASQFHSFDMLVMELLSAVMWFNPMMWKMKKEMQLIHEYLADEGALNTGIDKLRYQELLISQVMEEQFICLSSNFNHSLKKRMIMMSKTNFNHTKVKILALLPLTALFFGITAYANGISTESPVKRQIVNIIQEPLTIFMPEKLIASKNILNSSILIKNIKEKKSLSDTIKLYVKDSSKTGVNGEKIKITVTRGNKDNKKTPKKGDIIVTYDKNGKVIEKHKFKPMPDNILCVIDGIQSSKEHMNSLKPENIANITVLKGKQAEALYEIKGKYEAVVIITTKVKK